MKKLVVLFLLCAVLFAPVFAEDTTVDNSDEGTDALGMYCMFGSFYMVGLSYHHWFGNHGLMISAGLDNDRISALVEYQLSVYKAELTDVLDSRLYVWASGGANFRNDTIYADDTYHDEFHVNAIASLGIGIEFVWWKHLSIPVHFGYVMEMPYDFSKSFCVASGVRYTF